jgi:exopolyphosphatase/guanosine-5'-triphosphate,3'-diphosphate pyrophosphatase
MLCACIDIGSNTTRLLVAQAEDGQLRVVLQQPAFTRLGAKGGISAAKLSVCTEAVATQLRVARECGAEHVRIVGTHALRQAPNRDELIAAVEEATGATIDILSGEEEAHFAFVGATRTLGHLPLGEVGVVDVGGGSTEIVVGTLADGVTWAESFRIGSGYLADHYLRSDPPALTELDRLRRHVQGVFEGLDVPQPRVAYAVGGSATSLRRLVGAVLDHESLQRGMRVLAGRPAADIAREFELHAERVKLLPAGMLLLDAVADLLGTELRVARGGLREGVLLAELEAAGALT